jgi:hypothetical protein
MPKNWAFVMAKQIGRVNDLLFKTMLQCPSNFWRVRQDGNMWSSWPCYLSAFRDVLGLDLPIYEKFQYWEAAATYGGYRWMHPEFCIVSEFPVKLTIDEANRPHCEDGPSHLWKDGFSIYHWHGVRIAPEKSWIINHPERITPDIIDKEENQEIKRVMLERFTAERYIKEGGAKLLDKQTKLPGVMRTKGESFKNPTAELYQKQISGTDVTMTMVRVINSTPEPDGSWKEYWLEVAPDLRPIDPNTGELIGKPQAMTAWNAIASTWGMTGDEYFPLVET